MIAALALALSLAPGPLQDDRPAGQTLDEADRLLHEVTASVQPRRVIERLFGDDAPVEPVIFAGQPGTRRRTGSTRQGTDVLITTRGGFAFGLVAIGKLEDRERMARWFELSALPTHR